MEGKEEDVRLGANKYSERQPIGTAAQGSEDKDYKEPPPAPLFEPGELKSWSFYRAGIAEFMATFVLVYTVFSATDAKRNARDSHVPILAPLPIGFAVFLVHLATIPITGTGINPARSLGAAIIYNREHAWSDHWIFWVGPFIGAALAAVYHQVVIRAIPFKTKS
ncbi:unnamed protein product [Triticum turgidum subsp. durum]|uniref:Aquaporin n=1 Tax=Triticum turgidum subsp. durum TaxID=4567 RepID=A0A9R1P2B3_TRITD|nr:unnamed protein product [Triticum turgidum subsp. durum]VAH50557.1 unnamed protein product [Triticum turgidum subsp. durum]